MIRELVSFCLVKKVSFFNLLWYKNTFKKGTSQKWFVLISLGKYLVTTCLRLHRPRRFHNRDQNREGWIMNWHMLMFDVSTVICDRLQKIHLSVYDTHKQDWLILCPVMMYDMGFAPVHSHQSPKWTACLPKFGEVPSEEHQGNCHHKSLRTSWDMDQTAALHEKTMVLVDEVHRSQANHALLENLEKAIGAKLQLIIYTGTASDRCVRAFGANFRETSSRSWPRNTNWIKLAMLAWFLWNFTTYL